MTYKEARIERGLTQAEIARWACVDQSVVSRFENGQRDVDILTLCALLDALGAQLAVTETRQRKVLCVRIDHRQTRYNHELNDGTLPY